MSLSVEVGGVDAGVCFVLCVVIARGGVFSLDLCCCLMEPSPSRAGVSSARFRGCTCTWGEIMYGDTRRVVCMDSLQHACERLTM